MKPEKDRTCCFFGHGKADVEGDLYDSVKSMMETLIVEDKVDTFLFGRKCEFDILCFYAVTELKRKYPHIKRNYTRIDFPFSSDEFIDYEPYYDDVYYPGRILHEGDRKIVYMGESEKERLELSGTCLLYDEDGLQTGKPWFDFDYARQNKVCIIYMGK